MKGNGNKKPAVRVAEGEPGESMDMLQNSQQNKFEKLKKPIIFGLMGVVFIGCMYLVFRPSERKKEIENIGLNDAIPQPTEAGLPADKGKAYEQELLEQREQEKRSALVTLSDYWDIQESDEPTDELPEESTGFRSHRIVDKNSNPVLENYRDAQNTLSSFYRDDHSETEELRRQLDELKEKLAEKEEAKPATVDDQLALMEKSYQMAAKYFPKEVNTENTELVKDKVFEASAESKKENFVAFTPLRKNVVSSLYQELDDSLFLANWREPRNRGFYTTGITERTTRPRNGIRASVTETKTITDGTAVKLRLLESARMSNSTIPKGPILTAAARFQGGRLQLKITSIEIDGNIIPVDISVYDLDGQPGLYVPYSPEMNALTEMASNMSQTSGTSIMMTRSAGQQVAADLSRGVIQGVSGYFTKKIRMPKVTLRAGYQVFLVSKE